MLALFRAAGFQRSSSWPCKGVGTTALQAAADLHDLLLALQAGVDCFKLVGSEALLPWCFTRLTLTNMMPLLTGYWLPL